MIIHPGRLRAALSLGIALLGIAPAAAAQAAASAAFSTTLGDPIRYRISLPRDAEIVREDHMLYAVSDNVVIMVTATDMLKGEAPVLHVSDAEARGVITRMIMGSDSILLALLREGIEESGHGADLLDVRQGITTLGGQRAAQMTARLQEDGGEGWMEMRMTVKDGILYMLMFAVVDDEPAAHEPLFARIRDSFVLAHTVG